jgi:hypothetical protein
MASLFVTTVWAKWDVVVALEMPVMLAMSVRLMELVNAKVDHA